MATTREEHLNWCKGRALKYLERGDQKNAWDSMVSDLGGHPETAGHPAIELGIMLMLSGNMSSCEELKKFIEGVN